jgi:DNA-binding XRE family transcriptional regulator
MDMPEIIEIIAVEPYRIIARWSNGEIRQNDYTNERIAWQNSRNSLYSKVAEWENFRIVTVNDGVLSWPSIRVVFNMGEGTKSEPFEFDPVTTYQQSSLLVSTLLESNIGHTLANARHQAKLSQDELARRIGSTKQYISKVERGLVQPQTDTLQRIAAALGRRVALV